jgi:hypothetical protein
MAEHSEQARLPVGRPGAVVSGRDAPGKSGSRSTAESGLPPLAQERLRFKTEADNFEVGNWRQNATLDGILAITPPCIYD